MAADGSGAREVQKAPDTTQPRSEPTTEAREAWTALMLFGRELRGYFQSVHAALDLTPVQGHVLHMLEPGVPVPMHGLADGLGCDASNVTGLVDRLTARGLVERRAAEHDRRVKMLVLTEEGARVRAAMLAKLMDPPGPFLRMPAEDHRALRSIFGRMLETYSNLPR